MRIRDLNKENTIREKAIEMVVHHGFNGLSMQKLAAAASVSPATIYIYFKDREDLIFQLCLSLYRKMVDETLKDFDPQMSFADGLRIQWKNRAAYWINNPLEAQFIELVRHSHYNDKLYPHAKSEFSSIMRVFVKNAIHNKELLPLPLEIYWSVAFAPLYQLVKYHISGKGMPGTTHFAIDDAMLEQTLALVLKALKP